MSGIAFQALVALVTDPQTDLDAVIAHGSGQTIFREIVAGLHPEPGYRIACPILVAHGDQERAELKDHGDIVGCDFHRAFQQALAPLDAAAPPTGPARLLTQGRALIRHTGIADDAAIDALIARLDAIQHHPEYCSAGLDLTAVAVKPAVSIPLGERYR